MKNLIIIGTGNFSKIVYEYALSNPEYKVKWDIRGFIDFNPEYLKEDADYPDLISTIDDYVVQKDDVFICSYVDPKDRAKSVDLISQQGGEFINLIHPMANINRKASMGKGNIIGAFITLSVNTVLGNHIIIQDHCNVGHDSVIGDYSHLYVGNIICGKNQIGDGVSIFTGTTIYPKLKIGNRAVVGAGSVVMRTVKDDTTVIGNPAKKME